MKEMLRSKSVLLFVVVILGFVYVDSSRNIKLEEKHIESKQNIVMMNIK